MLSRTVGKLRKKFIRKCSNDTNESETLITSAFIALGLAGGIYYAIDKHICDDLPSMSVYISYPVTFAAIGAIFSKLLCAQPQIVVPIVVLICLADVIYHSETYKRLELKAISKNDDELVC